MAAAIFFLLMLGLLVFILWDRYQLKSSKSKPLDRAVFKHGYTPGEAIKWQGLIGGALLLAIIAAIELLDLSHPPFTGRRAWFQTYIYDTFGVYATGGLFVLFALVCAAGAVVEYRKLHNRRK